MHPFRGVVQLLASQINFGILKRNETVAKVHIPEGRPAVKSVSLNVMSPMERVTAMLISCGLMYGWPAPGRPGGWNGAIMAMTPEPPRRRTTHCHSQSLWAFYVWTWTVSISGSSSVHPLPSTAPACCLPYSRVVAPKR